MGSSLWRLSLWDQPAGPSSLQPFLLPALRAAFPPPALSPALPPSRKPFPPVHPHVCLRMSSAPSWTADVRSLSAGGLGQGHGLGTLPTSGSGFRARVFLCFLEYRHLGLDCHFKRVKGGQADCSQPCCPLPPQRGLLGALQGGRVDTLGQGHRQMRKAGGHSFSEGPPAE